jgi:hypothetical protein
VIVEWNMDNASLFENIELISDRAGNIDFVSIMDEMGAKRLHVALYSACSEWIG